MKFPQTPNQPIIGDKRGPPIKMLSQAQILVKKRKFQSQINISYNICINTYSTLYNEILVNFSLLLLNCEYIYIYIYILNCRGLLRKSL